MQVIKYMQSQVVRRKQQQGGYRPDLEEGGSKWLLWRRHREEARSRDDERKGHHARGRREASPPPVFDWRGKNTSQAASVGWGRRIYDQGEIESEDREREAILLKDDAVRNMKIRSRDVRGKFGLWDNVYDRKVIRALNCNASWEPNRKEKERRMKAAKKAEKEALKTQAKIKDDASGTGNANKNGDGNGEPKEKSMLAEVMMKWTETGEELTPDDLKFIADRTKFTQNTIKKWFKKFRVECPNGRLTKAHMHSLFKRVFPGGDSESFCDHIYRIFDSDGNGYLDFKEFLMALDVTSCRDEREKLEWAFRLYDVDSSGSINREEVLAIMGTLEEVIEVAIKVEEMGGDPGISGRQLSVENRAADIFNMLDADNDGELTMEEFVDGYLRIQASATAADKDKKRGSSGTVVKSVLVEERPLYTPKPNHASPESQEEDIKPQAEAESQNPTIMATKTQEVDG